ncbi:MAG: hypothetical protein CMJ24_03630 [Phycisphaerae bacterium]|nr:hypothetical protein [Phycisphaerae bacterium]
METLIVLNMLVYLAGLAGNVFGGISFEQLTNWMMLSRGDFHFWNLITYQFAHSPSDIFHLLFNMVGLWIFGTSLEDRLGHASMLAFYLIGGSVAGVAHMLETSAPVIGASGSVCALIGGFIALFPRSRIRILLLFLIIGVFEVGSLWVVGFYVLIDFVGWVAPSGSSTAYVAHISGYLYGFILAMLMLSIGILKSDDFDMLFLLRQARRRAAFRSTMRGSTATAWDTPNTAASKKPAVKRVDPKEVIRLQKIAELRGSIMRMIRETRFKEAGRIYRELLALDPLATLNETAQLDLANRLYADGERNIAAAAYERFLESYPRSSQADEIRLMLALMFTRELDRPEEARTLLADALPSIKSDSHRTLARTLLDELGHPDTESRP